MDRGFTPLKALLGVLAIGVIGVLGFLIFQGVKPTIKNAQPLNGSRAPKGDVTISAEIRGEADLHEVRLRVDSKSVDPVIKANSQRFWEVSYRASLPKGTHDVELVAVDVRGREQPYRWRFTASGPSNPPKFADPQPRDGSRLPQGEAMVSLAAFSELASLDSFTLKLNGVKLTTPEVKAAPGERTIAKVRRPLDPGEYQVVAEAVDNEGEKATYQWKFSVIGQGKGDTDTIFFKETELYVYAPFSTYWAKNGGLPIYGLPITPAFDKNGLTVQWFERARFEKNPQLPADRQVQLGLLGVESRKPDPPLTTPPPPDRLFFPETGHSLGGPFRAYWESHGGLAQFGLPLTEEITENGKTVQWFERARFEYNPQGVGTPNEVLLGQLGRTLWEQSNR
jgi:hypothetical protein